MLLKILLQIPCTTHDIPPWLSCFNQNRPCFSVLLRFLSFSSSSSIHIWTQTSSEVWVPSRTGCAITCCDFNHPESQFLHLENGATSPQVERRFEDMLLLKLRFLLGREDSWLFGWWLSGQHFSVSFLYLRFTLLLYDLAGSPASNRWTRHLQGILASSLGPLLTYLVLNSQIHLNVSIFSLTSLLDQRGLHYTAG